MNTTVNPVSTCRPHLPHDVCGVASKFPGQSPSINNIATRKIDELGEFVKLDTTLFEKYPCWSSFFHQIKGRSNFQPQVGSLPHKAASLISRYARDGVPVVLSSEPWSLQRKDAAIQRGNHPSVEAFAEFVQEEMLDMRRKGIFILLPYRLLRHRPELRISPLGCVPQRDRRPRIINDYTFSGVNPSTVKLAPEAAMQWGKTFHRMLWYIFSADRRHGPVLLSKTDLADGFYQIPLTPSGALKLAVPFPSDTGEPLLAIPTRLPMGWTESPPAFSSVTETIANLVNAKLASSQTIPPSHHLEAAASTHVPLARSNTVDAYPIQDGGPKRAPLAYTDVYVDDFVKAAQGWRNALRVQRHTYRTIDTVLRPNDLQDVGRKEPISEKKLGKGDDSWSTYKTILGWDVDTQAMTIALPPHRKERLMAILDAVLHRKRVSVQTWHKLLGELRSMSLAVSGSDGCFSFLQHALKPLAKRIKITAPVRHQLLDFRWLADNVSSRPTHLAEIVPTPPTYFGTVDASGRGMGGVWFPPGPPAPLSVRPPKSSLLKHPILWRDPFPQDIVDSLITFDNPRGTITNSDLELAGSVAQDDILAQAAPSLANTTSCQFSDNSATVAWRTKGNATTDGPAAYLLQASALHRRHYRYRSEVQHLKGDLNRMADDCSRLWNLDDHQLTTYFNSYYPQETSWHMHHLRPEMRSALISSLRRRRSPPESYLPEIGRQPKLGRSGVRFAPPSMQTLTFQKWPTLSHFSKPLASGGGTAGSPSTQTELARLRMRSGLSARGFPAWGP